MANQSRHSYVQFYPSDWLGGMAFMPPMAEWLYLQICLYNWDKRAPLPQAEARLRLSRSPSWEDDLAALIDAGKVHRTANGALFVERALIEAERAFELWDKKSRGGRAKKTADNQARGQQSSNTLGNTPLKSAGSNENENENENEIGDKSPSGDLVFSVPADAMANFRKHRVKIKAPMSQRAEELLLRELEKIHRERGHDPTAVMEQSILQGWRGVFPLKGADNGNRANDRDGLFGACTEPG